MNLVKVKDILESLEHDSIYMIMFYSPHGFVNHYQMNSSSVIYGPTWFDIDPVTLFYSLTFLDDILITQDERLAQIAVINRPFLTFDPDYKAPVWNYRMSRQDLEAFYMQSYDLDQQVNGRYASKTKHHNWLQEGF